MTTEIYIRETTEWDTVEDTTDEEMAEAQASYMRLLSKRLADYYPEAEIDLDWNDVGNTGTVIACEPHEDRDLEYVHTIRELSHEHCWDL